MMRAVHPVVALVVLALSSLAHLPARADGDYLLGPGDLLRITVFSYPDLATETRVSESGSIGFPLIGQVAVAGLSTADAERKIAQQLVSGAFIRDPQVSLLVAEYQSQKVSVLGQVLKPGQYALQSASRVIDVLAMAGGHINETAGDEAVLLHEDGQKQIVDLRALLEGDMRQNVPLARGDKLIVSKAHIFYISGQVQKPGPYKLERNMTVAQAISAGGGLTLRGSARRVVVTRVGNDGKRKDFSVRGTDMVKPDDVLLVKESIF